MLVGDDVADGDVEIRERAPPATHQVRDTVLEGRAAEVSIHRADISLAEDVVEVAPNEVRCVDSGVGHVIPSVLPSRLDQAPGAR
jgi:ElaB/YqjD/DUF883 family membrane-anchored ribosome-binding protein